jgi:NADPH:quinone reductase-like Zn-dependent oxidoreductase
MKAARFHDYGGPEALVFEEAPLPKPEPDDILIRVHAASVNPADWKVRAGFMRGVVRLPLPYIPGLDVSGVVERTNGSGTSLSVGDEVYADTGDFTRQGTYAEHVAVPATKVARKPASLDHLAAAAVPVAALTARQALFDAAELQPGQTVLIHGAAGGVGSFAVQFARWQGARVLATASTRHQQFLRQLGADEAIDYTKTRFEDVAREVDVVLDTIGGEVQERSWRVIRAGGVLVSVVGPPDDSAVRDRGLRGMHVFTKANGARLSEIARLIDEGKIKPVIAAVLPLEKAGEAQAMNEEGHTRGKIVLRVV